MVKEIVTDPKFLTKKCRPFIWGQHNYIIKHLLDTAKAQGKNCAGVAAPQIGEDACVVAVLIGKKFMVMVNPEITMKIGRPRRGYEGCLSCKGSYMVERSPKIYVKYEDENGVKTGRWFYNIEARRIQHEVDHLHGILISGGM